MPRFFCFRALSTIALFSWADQLPALGQPAEKVLTVADCVKVLRPDSVHLFFNSDYALTQPDCAISRRESRMDAATGSFTGEVRDYKVADNSLLHRIQYTEGLRNGHYEQYHENHQLAVKGQFTKGQPSGPWQYWYPNGRPQQIVEWTGQAQPRFRIMAYWDTAGEQKVVDGTGIWQGTTGGYLPSRYFGRITNGYQQENWEARSLKDNDLFTVEKFVDGQLVEGQQFVGGYQNSNKPIIYKTKPSLQPTIAEDASTAAEPLHLGKTCEAQTRSSYNLTTSEKFFLVIPQPPQELTNYQSKVIRRLSELNNLIPAMPRTDAQSVVITADIDAKGQLHDFVCKDPAVAAAFAAFISKMGAWHPGTAFGVMVPGRAKFTLWRSQTELRCQVQTAIAYPLPTEVVKNFKKN